RTGRRAASRSRLSCRARPAAPRLPSRRILRTSGSRWRSRKRSSSILPGRDRAGSSRDAKRTDGRLAAQVLGTPGPTAARVQCPDMPQFQPFVRRWFEQTFKEATPPRRQGWDAIASGRDTLIVAPTGSGKTLAAFLWAIDHLHALGRD